MRLQTVVVLVAAVISTAVVVFSAVAESAHFISRQLTPAGEYTFGIEGPAVDVDGTLYVVNHRKQGTIGKVRPGAAVSEHFLDLPTGSIGNSIRIGRDRLMFIADYKAHNVFVLPPGETKPRVYFWSERFNQPNDMAIAADDTIYASDPNWKRRDGQIWRITRGVDGKGVGAVMTSDRKLTTTNGIDLSPDEKTLYVGELETREVWAYRIEGNKLAAPRLIRKFDDFSIDGLRTDIDGRIFVTRILKGTVAILSPDGKIDREIQLVAKEPTNIAFGGIDGRTAFVTQRQGGFIESFRVQRPGRDYCLQIAPVKYCQ